VAGVFTGSRSLRAPELHHFYRRDRRLWLPTEPAAPIALAVHAGYEFTPPAIPAPALEESLAEKLAAWRRRRKLGDLYDLDLFGHGALNETLIRRLLVLKVWHDVVDDGLGQRPSIPARSSPTWTRNRCHRRTSDS
jgi:predicted nucleotidyltransferase component of viral defense system